MNNVNGHIEEELAATSSRYVHTFRGVNTHVHAYLCVFVCVCVCVCAAGRSKPKKVSQLHERDLIL